EDEVKIANMLPATPEEIAGKTGKPVDKVNSMLAELFKKGGIFESSKGYRPARDIIQLHDATGSDVRSDGVWGRDLLDAWWDFSENELYKDVAKWAKDFVKPASRVIPSRASIADPGKLMPDEDIEGIIDSTTRIAVVKCPCRRMAQKCDRPLEVCLQLNKGAEYTIKRGSGREVSKEEAKKILRTAAEGGLVHSVGHTAGVGHNICNCCPDCCIFMEPWLTNGVVEKGIAKSRFEAKVDAMPLRGNRDGKGRRQKEDEGRRHSCKMLRLRCLRRSMHRRFNQALRGAGIQQGLNAEHGNAEGRAGRACPSFYLQGLAIATMMSGGRWGISASRSPCR
ncbi:MAG: hypothetical protein NT177_08485, partial [Chloroflexi bacterium]|nr:hypothetical protein [Chloroflexota bacterium]